MRKRIKRVGDWDRTALVVEEHPLENVAGVSPKGAPHSSMP